MEVIITFDEEGRFHYDRSEGTSIFDAIGMMELAKVIMLSEGGAGNASEDDVSEEEMTEEDTNEDM